MLEKYGLLWVRTSVGLSEAKWFCNAFEGETEEQRVFRIGTMIPKTLAYGLGLLRQVCILSDMDAVLPEIERLEQLVWPSEPGMPKAHPMGVAQAINHLITRVQDELDAQYFFHLTQTDVHYYQSPTPFGEVAATRFQRASEDISEAAKCLALQRPVACVFHLMRVMELGVQAYGKKMKVAIDPQSENWSKIMDHVGKGIKAMPVDTPRRKAKKAKYALVAATLDHVRIAWRNEVMHPKQTYTRQEAFDMFNAVRVFINELAETI